MTDDQRFTRRQALGMLAVLTATGVVATDAVGQQPTSATLTLDRESLRAAERLVGVDFTDSERDLMMEDVKEALEGFKRVREIPIPNSVPPAISFSPLLPGTELTEIPERTAPNYTRFTRKPTGSGDLAYMTIVELGALLRTERVTSVELTELYLGRLEEFDPELHCVITLTKERALRQARKADRELKAGFDRGPLHGIPWGAKDLLAVAEYPTTWGATPYKDQVIDETATVVERLDEAGAVLVAKLTLGALAYGDVWFGEMTRNPWNLEQGSSGSSAGSASAVAAGCLPFAIGSETLGSIVSPCTRCGATGLRPTFGAVSRHGAMALSWTMDKLGPITRTAEDASLVLEAIHGADGFDSTVQKNYEYRNPSSGFGGLRIGFVKSDFEGETASAQNDLQVLDDLKNIGAKLVEVSIPDRIPAGDLLNILMVEAAAAFDDLTRSGRDDLMVRQVRAAWPNLFRAAQLVPGVEYIRANRLRTLLMEDMAEVFEDVDCYVAPSFSTSLIVTNLTGHPALVMPNGFDENDSPTSITFTGNLYREDQLVQVARAWQESTIHHRLHPDHFTQ